MTCENEDLLSWCGPTQPARENTTGLGRPADRSGALPIDAGSVPEPPGNTDSSTRRARWPSRLSSVQRNRDGLAAVRVGDGKTGKYGFVWPRGSVGLRESPRRGVNEARNVVRKSCRHEIGSSAHYGVSASAVTERGLRFLFAHGRARALSIVSFYCANVCE